MFEFRTQGFSCYAVRYSPFFDSRIAVGCAANYGLVGNGRLHVLNLTPKGIVAEKVFDTQDAIYDLSWSELHENQIAVATGDGSIKLFDVGLEAFPVASWKEHKREVYAVHWNLVTKDTFCSSSWDGCVKVWSPNRAESLVTLPTGSCTYSALFSPHSHSVLSCVSSDSHLRVFDLRTPVSAANHLTLAVPIHADGGPVPSPPAEALTHDWNKYREGVIATAGVDRLIRTFDLRAMGPGKGALTVLDGHDYAVRRLAWSPHLSDTLLSASYDMTCRVWTDGSVHERKPMPQGAESAVGPSMGKQLGRMDRHTEFVVGVDWCLFGAEGWCASCGWDERVLVWDVRQIMGG